MNDIRIEEGHLVVDQAPAEKVGGLQGRLRIPLAHVRGATADPGVAAEPRGVRAPGVRCRAGRPGRSTGTARRSTGTSTTRGTTS